MSFALPLLGGVAGALASKALKPKPAPATPTEPGPRVMPLADDEAVRRARRVSLAQQLARGGRTSTMLTPDTAPGKVLG